MKAICFHHAVAKVHCPRPATVVRTHGVVEVAILEVLLGEVRDVVQEVVSAYVIEAIRDDRMVVEHFVLVCLCLEVLLFVYLFRDQVMLR